VRVSVGLTLILGLIAILVIAIMIGLVHLDIKRNIAMKKSSLSLSQRFVYWSLTFILIIASTAFAVQPALAAKNHCITPFGVDLNVLFGISTQIVTPFCTQIDSGEALTTPGGTPWVMNTSFATAPEGFIAAGATPMEDFLAKFIAAKAVLDAGTSKEKTYIFPNGNKLWRGTFLGFPAVQTATLTILKSLSVGKHTVQLYWVFSAMHCDGFGDVVQDNCLGPGGVAYGPLITFQVTPS
jgi:hypothetical protein